VKWKFGLNQIEELLMSFGIDTFRSRLDLRPTGPAISAGGDFFAWNGGARPLFAGRNFLGDDFIWGHAEATNASSEPDGAAYPLQQGDPSPENPENLTLLVDRVAPIQAPQPARQQLTDHRGRLFGQIDADAICKRVVAAIHSGEVERSDTTGRAHVWLSVDPDVPFSEDYWAGWADTVNNFPLTVGFEVEIQPFMAAVICRYVAGTDGRLRPEPHVIAALASRHRGMDTSVHGRWADLRLWDNAPADLLANGSPLLDWNRFDPPTAPVLWRFAHGFNRRDGTPAGVPFDVDAASPMADPLDFMLQPQRWQPNVPSIRNPGFSNTDAITAAQIDCFHGTDLQDINDTNFSPNRGHFRVPGGRVKVVGRYIRHSAALSMGAPEAQMLSDAGFSLFTIWETARNLGGGMGVSESSQDDEHAIDHWGPFNTNLHKNIFYFNPDPDGNPATHDDAGTQDGTEAFRYCRDVLRQPPHTPVFFAIDFDPYDLLDPHGVPPWPPPGTPVPPPPAPPPPQPADYTRGWPELPAVAERERWIRSYFENIKAARDDLATRTGRHYLIGVYCSGATLQLLYEQGIASHFWQAASAGRTGSGPPHWPWYHANRWQYRGNQPYCNIRQIDPDADWGDGGTWSYDPLAENLNHLERFGFVLEFFDWGDFVVPPPPPPPPP